MREPTPMYRWKLPIGSHCHVLSGAWPDQTVEDDLWCTTRTRAKALRCFAARVAYSIGVRPSWIKIDPEDVQQGDEVVRKALTKEQSHPMMVKKEGNNL
jgi:hypothetical protein